MMSLDLCLGLATKVESNQGTKLKANGRFGYEQEKKSKSPNVRIHKKGSLDLQNISFIVRLRLLNVHDTISKDHLLCPNCIP